MSFETFNYLRFSVCMCLSYCVRVFACVCTSLCVREFVRVCVYLCAWQKHDMICAALAIWNERSCSLQCTMWSMVMIWPLFRKMPVNQKTLNQIGIFWYHFTPRNVITWAVRNFWATLYRPTCILPKTYDAYAYDADKLIWLVFVPFVSLKWGNISTFKQHINQLDAVNYCTKYNFSLYGIVLNHNVATFILIIVG